MQTKVVTYITICEFTKPLKKNPTPLLLPQLTSCSFPFCVILIDSSATQKDTLLTHIVMKLAAALLDTLLSIEFMSHTVLIIMRLTWAVGSICSFYRVKELHQPCSHFTEAIFNDRQGLIENSSSLF